MAISNVQLCVRRGGSQGLAIPSLVESSLNPHELTPGQILLRVEKFGFSANNITYGVLGDDPHFRYYDFYPAPTTSLTSPETHGIIPVWGFGTVIHSAHPTVKVGQRLYGYLAMSRYLILQLDPQTNRHHVNIALGDFPKDRRPYKQLNICENDAMYRPDREEEIMLYRPLFWTAYWFEDYLNEHKYRGAKNILVSSASSKTAFALAYNIGVRKKQSRGSLDVNVVGLTSASNAPFTRGLDLYDSVLTYEDIPTLYSTGSWIYVDVSSSPSLMAKIEHQLAPILTITLGSTTPNEQNVKNLWSSNHQTANHEGFFMPEWLAIRVKQLTVPQITSMQNAAWNALMESCASWVSMDKSSGGWAVLEAYKKTLEGRIGPDKGQVFTLWDSPADFRSPSKL